MFSEFKAKLYSSKDYRSKDYVKGTSETVQAAIKEEGASVRAGIGADKDCHLKNLDLKMDKLLLREGKRWLGSSRKEKQEWQK